ncbi:MAG: O-antigen ligase family protein [Chloroflexi bacterium]|nr:O-antigen ligase family protein [Chloroflexota bacterium]
MNKIAIGRFKRTPLDIFFALYLLTAAVGVWAAYDREVAWAKFGFLAGAVAIYYAVASQPQESVWPAAGVLSAGAALLAGIFSLTRVLRIGNLDPHVFGGVIAMFIPINTAFGLWAWKERRRALAALAIVSGAVSLAGFVFASKRGALLGLGVAFGVWLLWRLSRYAGKRQRLAFILTLGFAAIGAIVFVALFPGLVIKVAAPGNRLEVLPQVVKLVTDFPFTGGGLGSFPGLLSRYILVIPWLFMPHSSNLFLDTLVEQGVFGLIALAGIFVGSFWLLGTRPVRALYITPLQRWAALAGLIVMAVYCLVEDPFHSGWPTLLLFVLPGFGVAATEPKPSAALRPSLKIAVAVGALAALAGLLVAFRQQGLAAWYANLGAVEMARVELAGWPETVRWQSDFDLTELRPAETLFNQALQFAPGNVTANYRLGLIAAKQGNETEAVARWSLANQTSPSHRGIRKVLGYAYVWQGRLDQAIVLLNDIPEAKNEMDTYSWWWGTQGRDDLAAQAAAMVRLLP